MDRLILFASIFALLLTACSGGVTPTSAPAPTKASTVATAAPGNTSSPAQTSASQSRGAGLETKSNEGGGVTVDVKPAALEVGQPLAFDIAMNTHSVDLSDDMTKITVLRDDAGKEYKPTAWEDSEAGGHHREGTLKFAPLTTKPRYVEVVIKGLAKVPERVFRWDLLR